MKLFLDTTVFSAYYDKRSTERLELIKEFWRVLMEHERLSLKLTIEELNQVKSASLRRKLLDLTNGFTVLKIGDRERELAKEYVKWGMIPVKYLADAIHVAVAVLGGVDIVVSWNFKHLVKRDTRLLVNYVNTTKGLKNIEILAPPEV